MERHENAAENSSRLALAKSSQSFDRLLKFAGTPRKAVTKKKKPANSRISFKYFILQLNKQLNKVVGTKMKLGSMSLEQLDDLVSHIIDMIEMELFHMNRIYRKKTVTAMDLETAVKFCFPRLLSEFANDYGRLAIQHFNGKH